MSDAGCTSELVDLSSSDGSGGLTADRGFVLDFGANGGVFDFVLDFERKGGVFDFAFGVCVGHTIVTLALARKPDWSEANNSNVL